MDHVLTEPVATDGGLTFYQGYTDAARCQCGNDVTSEGFIALEDNLQASDIRDGSNARFPKLLCVGCGRVYTWHDDVTRPTTDLDDYWVRYEQMGDLLTQLTREQTDTEYARFEKYASSPPLHG